MSSDINDFLDHVDQWKLELHNQLKRMTPAQRRAFWDQIHEEARTRGLPVAEGEGSAKRPTKRARRSG
jgi:hypothetical protein